MNLDKIIYTILDKVTNIKIAEDSPMRDSMFWYILATAVLYFGVLFWGILGG